jgi:ferric-dicitrate binding protein FerR (iron transport regulator)
MEKKDTNNHIPWDAIINRLQEKPGISDAELDTWLKKDLRHQLLWEDIQLAWMEIRMNSSEIQPDKEKAWIPIKSKIEEKRQTILPAEHKILILWRWAAVACIPLLIGLSVGLLFNNRSLPDGTTCISYRTQNGKSFITLPDGSHVWLNANSSLDMPISFGKQTRQVRVNGEVFFDVRNQPDIPFVVKCRSFDIKVYGTRFNVRESALENYTAVTLLEGSVSIYTEENEKETSLTPGNAAYFNTSTNRIDILPADTFLAALWADNKLVLEDQPLGKVAEALEAWFRKKIIVASQLKNIHYYRLTIREESLDEMLKLMQKTGKFNYRTKNDTILIY